MSSLFRDFTHSRFVTKVSEQPIGPIYEGLPETSVAHDQSPVRKIPEERKISFIPYIATEAWSRARNIFLIIFISFTYFGGIKRFRVCKQRPSTSQP